jgi:hypothetical protein
MKIALTQTYFCDQCERYAFPHDLRVTHDAEDNFGFMPPACTRFWIIYRCACGRRLERVEHIIDENGELFPHYKPTGMK